MIVHCQRGAVMSGEISADVEQMLENIHTLVKSIEAAGVGTRPTQIHGLRTNTTAPFIDSASSYTAGVEEMIATLAVDAAAFRDAVKAVLEQKQQSEESLSGTLAQIQQVVDDPTLTSTTHLQSSSQTRSGVPEQQASGVVDDGSTDDGAGF
ncbi:hypothetical protein CW368_12160 [Actinomycetales bacterium SN12]|nr:hypothetical protein CW368_12160 [Actinomycetales bacterium SN12]